MMSDKDYDPICCTEEKKYIMKEILARTKAKQIPWKCKDVVPLSFHEIAAEDLLLNPALVHGIITIDRLINLVVGTSLNNMARR